MQHFASMGAFAEHLLRTAVGMYAFEQAGLERCLSLIEKTAVEEFGVYQPTTGPFPAWEELAERTKDERVALGFTENDPLLRSGDLRDSSQHEVRGLEGVAGSTDERMPWLEFGTQFIPPRPVWGAAAFRNKAKIQRILGEALVGGLIGGSPIHPTLGYDFKTP